MPLFSIIVPIYNKASTLKRCIDSVLGQEFGDWELLLLDDGSKDWSLSLAQSFSDARIRVFHHSNIGVSATRNEGIRISTGRYLVFLDADDYWDATFLENIAASIDTHRADIYLTGLTMDKLDGTLLPLYFPIEGNASKKDVLPSFYDTQRTTQLYGFVANKAVRKAFLDENRLSFDEALSMAEDLDFFLRCFERCDFFYFVHDAGYHYVQYDEGSSMFRKDINYFSLIETQRKMIAFCQGYLTSSDYSYHQKKIANLCHAALSEVHLEDLHRIPGIVERIKKDKELNILCPVSDPIWWLTCRLFFRRLYIGSAQRILKLCRK